MQPTRIVAWSAPSSGKAMASRAVMNLIKYVSFQSRPCHPGKKYSRGPLDEGLDFTGLLGQSIIGFADVSHAE